MSVPSAPVNDVILQRAAGSIGMRIRRVASFVVALVLVCAAQYVFTQRDTTFIHQFSARQLQDFFRFDVLNLENSITALLLLIVAAFLLLRSLLPYSDNRGEIAGADAQHRPNLRAYLRRDGLLIVVAIVVLGLLCYQAHLADNSSGLVFVWIFGLGLLVRAAYRFDRDAGAPLSLGMTRADVVWIVLLLVGGLLVGSYQLDNIPNSLVRDEGNFFERAKAIAGGEERMSFFDVGVYSYPLPSSLYQGSILQIFGVTLWSWRFSSVLAGVLTVIPLYLLAREMFDRRVAVISGLLLVTLPYFLAFARLGYNNIQAVLPVTLAIYFIYLAVRRGSALFYVLAGIGAGLGFYTYTAGRLGAVVGAAFLGYLLLVRLIQCLRRISPEQKQAALADFRRLLAGTIVFGAISLATLLPQVLYTNTTAPDLLRYKTLESLFPNVNYALAFFPAGELYRDNPPIAVGAETFFYRPDLYARLLVRGIVRSLLVFQQGSLVTEHYMASPLAGPLGAIFYFIGLVLALRNLRRREFILILFWWFGGTLLLSMINTFPPRYQHMVPIIPSLALFSALGLVTTVDVVTQAFRSPRAPRLVGSVRRPLAVLPLAILSVLVAVIVATNLRNYFVEMPQEYLPGIEDIIAFQAIHVAEPTNVVYVYDEQRDEGWTPWMIVYVPTQVVYRSVSAASLQDAPLVLQPGRPTIVYFYEQDAEVVKVALQKSLVLGDIQPTIYRDDLQRVIGMSYTFDGTQVVESYG